MMTNRFKENIIQGWLLYVIRSFYLFFFGFCFQYQLINFVWLSIDIFSFSWSQPRPQNVFRKLKTSFLPSSYSEKMCWGQGWAKASLSPFSWLYILVCAVVQKYHEMFFIYNYSHFRYSFCNQPILFVQLENVNKLWNNNRTLHVNEQNQTKTTTTTKKSRHIQIGHVCCSI